MSPSQPERLNYINALFAALWEDVSIFVELDSGGLLLRAFGVVGVGQPPSRTDDEGDRGEQHLPEEADRSGPRAERAGAVLVSLSEIAESAKEGLLALAVGTGIQVMHAMMDADVAALAGPRAATIRTGSPCAWVRGWFSHVGRAAHRGASAAGTRRRRLG